MLFVLYRRECFVQHFSKAIGVQFMNEELGAGSRFECFISGRVIGMTVGINNMGYPVLLLLGFG